jgi:hypothetical protein
MIGPPTVISPKNPKNPNRIPPRHLGHSTVPHVKNDQSSSNLIAEIETGPQKRMQLAT